MRTGDDTGAYALLLLAVLILAAALVGAPRWR
jgi:LPXTG-motif cell wall-anchored protein